MDYPAHRDLLRRSALAITIITAGVLTARADIIQPDATLPPPTGVYTLPLLCIPQACLQNTRIFGFNNTSVQLVSNNELVSATAMFAADVFQNNAGTPGMP